jgi:SusD/RagB-like outer membrane lipoprotein
MRDKRLGFAGVVALGALVAIGMTGCRAEDLAGINRDPNNPTSAPPKAVFTYAMRTAVTRWLGAAFSLRRAEFTAQHLAEVQYPDDDAYRRIGAADTDGDFIGAYSSELKNFQAVVDAGKTQEQPLLSGPALVMRSLIFSYITDVWGDVPYSEALKGDSPDAVITPKYDAQKDIYDSLFVALTSATADMAAAPANALTLGSADPVYAGNGTKWRKFANSIRARLAMRLANADATKGKAELQAALSAPGGLIASNADNARFPWPGDGIYDNPWAANFRTRDDHRMSNTLMNEMLPVSDPRVSVYAQPTVANPSVYAGMPNALTQAGASAYFTISSRPGAVFYGATVYSCPTCGARTGTSFGSFIMTYAEVSFILAEAAERGWTGGSAAALYEQGIRASMDQWGVTNTAAINAFLANSAIAYKGGTPGLRQIALQKWIALYTDGVQAWAEWRRTCIPSSLKPGPDAIQSTVPRRYKYSIREGSVNAANLAEAVARMGADDFNSRMYWDKNPTAAPTYPGATCGQR